MTPAATQAAAAMRRPPKGSCNSRLPIKAAITTLVAMKASFSNPNSNPYSYTNNHSYTYANNGASNPIIGSF